MSSRKSIQQVVSSTEPVGGSLGDEWLNSTTGVLRKLTLVNGVVQYLDVVTPNYSILQPVANVKYLEGAVRDPSWTSWSGGNIPVRSPNGYLYSNYYNTPADKTIVSPSHIAVQTSSDDYIRWQTQAQFKTNLGIIDPITLAASLRANNNISGGGTITVNATGSILWSTRFIVIANGTGSNFSTTGYFDITCPTSGTVTGVGGAADQTATAAGVGLSDWQALYYILPIGSANTSLAANFRVVLYTSALDIPYNWVLICVKNAESGYFHFPNGVNLKVNQSSTNGYIPGSLTVTGDLTVNGTTTTINSTVTTVDDITFELGSVASPTDATAAGGGIVLKGATDKTITWSAANGWTSTEDLNVATGKIYRINGTSVLSGTALGSGVTGSSLTSVGTITTGTWSGSFGAVSGANLTSLTAGNLSGTIPSAVLANSTVNIGTTAVALNRASANQALTGISSVALPGATSGTITLTPAAVAGTTAITIPATAGTLVTTGDTGTVTNTMLAGSIATSKITGLATSATTDTTNAANISSGTLPAARMPALTGDVTTVAGAVAATLATVNANVGAFGSASSIPVITVNAKGLITAVSTSAVSIPSGSISVTGGDLTLSGTTGTAITNATLATVNSNTGSFGSATSVPVITVNAKGLITAVSTATVTSLPTQTSNAGKFLTTDGTTASWTSTTAAAGGGIQVNTATISTTYTIPVGSNGFSVGPITVANGTAITVSSGQRWVVI